jgi:hypothetical protein
MNNRHGARDLPPDRIAIVAPYRDQNEITTDDPSRPLGPFIPSGTADHHTYCQAQHGLGATGAGEHVA